MKFFIFHGSFGSPEGNWFPWLKKQLLGLGQTVLVPQFPVDKWENVSSNAAGYNSSVQNLAAWTKKFDSVYKNYISKEDKLCFIGHSIGPVFILHILQKYNIKLEAAIFVQPFAEPINILEFDLVNASFYKKDFDYENIKRLINRSYVVYSDNDKFVPRKMPEKFAQNLGSKMILVKNGGHLNADSGYAKFPLILDLCRKIIG